METAPFALRSTRIVTPTATLPATLLISHGKIESLLPYDAALPSTHPLTDLGTLAILPGLVDTHVHINDPHASPRLHWEGFNSATKAAAAGGITTLIDMPLNSTPVTTTLAALQQKQTAFQNSTRYVDVGFHAGLIHGNAHEITALLDAGAIAVKAFLVHSGIDDFPAATESDLRAILPLLASRNIPLLAHAELDEIPPTNLPNENPRSYARYLASRPPHWETSAIDLLIRLAKEFNAPIHIVHLATAEALPALHAARAAGIPITVETCPHYLHFTAEEIPDGATQYKCAPPIREAATREALWHALQSHDIDMIASDHSPCPPELKQCESGDFSKAWGGISSLQFTLPILWTDAHPRNIPLHQLAQWLSTFPAHLARLPQKGSIAPGKDADLLIFNPEATFTVDPAKLHHRHKLTPYANQTLRGAITQTYLRGQLIFDQGNFPIANAGQILSHATLPTLTHDTLQKCNGSSTWITRMLSHAFSSMEQLLATADQEWFSLSETDWLEAFTHHPKIGDVNSLRKKFANTAAWASNEQSAVQSADEETIEQLAAGNAAYENKFGFIFIICATGKSAAEMLAALNSRLANDRPTELKNAAIEQAKITQLRLKKLQIQ